ncbi:hypothetical protein WICMUC_005585 [Wickerhamomyces mucosus]|uniref:Uncharacterized protein n=1 Tax=Wickerhamomyces mucosus TaxID=1378264 RepID=A0A9P8T5A8_9ASCO|nr:hypothetical protein WICMUC_005585 [Wickerhamomyces mucosus]
MTENSFLKQPPPEKTLTKGILSPHNSILDVLNHNIQDSSEELDETILTSNQTAPQHLTSHTKFNVNSWLDINNTDYSNIYPVNSRPNSSVLSSSPDMEASPQFHHHDGHHHNHHYHLQDQKEQHQRQQHSQRLINGDQFVLPDLSTTKFYGNDDEKILIIGYKRAQIYQCLSSRIQGNFTLNSSYSSDIVLIVFNGLQKIGNILNQLNNLYETNQNVVIIPFYKNIHFKIISQLLSKFNILCHPINYSDKFHINMTLSTILTAASETEEIDNLPFSYNYDHCIDHDDTDKNYINLSDNENCTIELPLNQNELIPIGGKSIIVKHQISKSIKRRRKSSKHGSKFKKIINFGLFLSIGIGVGFLSAYSISYFKNLTTKSNPKDHYEIIIKRSKAEEIIKTEAIALKNSISKVVNSIVEHSKKVIKSWDSYVSNTTAFANNSSLLWYF